jgi:hypothetical protein
MKTKKEKKVEEKLHIQCGPESTKKEEVHPCLVEMRYARSLGAFMKIKKTFPFRPSRKNRKSPPKPHPAGCDTCGAQRTPISPNAK